jgi:hypothetical protein
MNKRWDMSEALAKSETVEEESEYTTRMNPYWNEKMGVNYAIDMSEGANLTLVVLPDISDEERKVREKETCRILANMLASMYGDRGFEVTPSWW